ncbi:MAG: PQQ-binding-like beta-propeller repeat protein [Phycisphaerae bacterium]
MKNFCFVCLFVIIFSTLVYAGGISEKLLNQAGLSTVWQTAVALDAGENVQRIDILGDYLYALTDKNYLFCIDRNTGKSCFSATVALPQMPVSTPSSYKNTAYVVAENKLIAFDTLQRTEISRITLHIPVSAAAAANKEYIYLPGMDKRLHVLDANSGHELFKVTADDFSAITSVSAAESSVTFATAGGSIICMQASSPKRIWQFNAVGGITAPFASAANFIYAAGRDTNLYKIDAYSGKSAWNFPFHTGSVLTTSPRATQTTVYQYAQNKGIYAIDANSGKQLWLLPDGEDLLAQNGDTAYIMDKNNNCVAMDNQKAKKIYTINFAPVTAYTANTADAKIYIMDGKNISCIAPSAK